VRPAVEVEGYERSRFEESRTGPDGLLDELKCLDLASLSEELRRGQAELEARTRSRTSERWRQLSRRRALVDALREWGDRPEWAVLTVLPVLPPEEPPPGEVPAPPGIDRFDLSALSGGVARPEAWPWRGRVAREELEARYLAILSANAALRRKQEGRPPGEERPLYEVLREGAAALRDAVEALFALFRERAPGR
jgi:hypothetical protein